jgi:hypothetical protein
MNNSLLERLAALEHEQWAAWTLHLLSNQTPENIERWQRQMVAAYDELSASEKEADRAWAKKVSPPKTPDPMSCSKVAF